jgi:hypothetical protein
MTTVPMTPTRRSQIDRELSLVELLVDPIAQRVLARHGATEEAVVEDLIGAVRAKRASRRTKSLQNEPPVPGALGFM